MKRKEKARSKSRAKTSDLTDSNNVVISGVDMCNYLILFGNTSSEILINGEYYDTYWKRKQTINPLSKWNMTFTTDDSNKFIDTLHFTEQ